MGERVSIPDLKAEWPPKVEKRPAVIPDAEIRTDVYAKCEKGGLLRG